MSTTLFINDNGKVKRDQEPVFTAQNRAFHYGDGLFESLLLVEGKIPLIKKHMARILEGAALLKLTLPFSWTLRYFETRMLELASLNKAETRSKIRLTFYRDSPGNYAPQQNQARFLIECAPLEPAPKLEDHGLNMGIYTELYKGCNKLSNYKTNNSLIYVLASIFAQERNLDDCILVNQRGLLAEATSSNFFYLKQDVLHTPALHQGCVKGVMRDLVLELAEHHQFKVAEGPVRLEQLLLADELFLTNAVNGVVWVKQFMNKQYPLLETAKFHQWVQEALAS